MRRLRNRIKYTLNAENVKTLSEDEMRAILRAAEELIHTGGRSTLAKILKGSQEEKLLDYGFDQCPSYGYYEDLSVEEITQRIDYMIVNKYLKVEYIGQASVLAFTNKGWKIERQTYMDEILMKLTDAAYGEYDDILEELETVNPVIIQDVLHKIGEIKDPVYLDILEEWKVQEIPKVRSRIDQVIERIKAAQKQQFSVINGGRS